MSGIEVPTYRARILSDNNEVDIQTVNSLRADPGIEFIDVLDSQVNELVGLLPSPPPDLLSEPYAWVYYSWRRSVVRSLGPKAYRAVRLDRNRNKITREEQDRLGKFRIGVVGLSVGHAIAYTLAMEGLCRELRLADFDNIELTNLNRIPASMLDLGLNKAIVAARRIAEIDPYLSVVVYPSGVSREMMPEFVDGLDLVVEECDSLDMKVAIRDAAIERRIPILMETSDRGLLDVERYDLEPDRKQFHGLLGDEFDFSAISDLSPREKIPHIHRILDASEFSPRLLASFDEVGRTLSTWPQLAGDVQLGGASVAAAVRRIGLGEPLKSGRTRVDIEHSLDNVSEPAVSEEGSRLRRGSADSAIGPNVHTQ
ncbi:Rv1355c family protein [Antrihabitans cavernicola]|uniref:Rv1355c family protein n=1 Tax=Antrihabitans cavernicola TaxID=2495913 RepID=A0A5A7SD11_9NOCA|nr:Rv1355c family protein [Spelaeibacter cavernicola]KAA0023796.1 Rv1355c family protein [Spelaeibacter cavernicola]